VLPNDNLSMSVGHLDHVLILQLDGARDLEITWSQAVNNQDVIKMSDGHRNVVIR